MKLLGSLLLRRHIPEKISPTLPFAKRGKEGMSLLCLDNHGPNVLTFSYSLLGLFLPFLASFVPLPSVALIMPIFYDRLIDNLSTN